jgi:hypothetical protein
MLSLQNILRKALRRPARENFCQTCRQIDFAKVVNIGREKLKGLKYGIVIAKLGNKFEEEPKNTCALCHLFYARRIRIRTQDFIQYELRAVLYCRWSRIFMEDCLHWPDHPCLVVVPEHYQIGIEPIFLAPPLKGYLFCCHKIHTQAMDEFRKPGQAVLFQELNTWLSYCKDHHTRCRGSILSHWTKAHRLHIRTSGEGSVNRIICYSELCLGFQRSVFRKI